VRGLGHTEPGNPRRVHGVSPCMKILGIAALWIVFSQPVAIGADVSTPKPDAGATIDGGARPAADRSQPGVNLIAFVGRKIEARYVERKPKPNEWLLDAEFFLRCEVLEVVFGSYPRKEIAFSSYVHIASRSLRSTSSASFTCPSMTADSVRWLFLSRGVCLTVRRPVFVVS
jgi:hypothetical protein